jgi:hypothetical protein
MKMLLMLLGMPLKVLKKLLLLLVVVGIDCC